MQGSGVRVGFWGHCFGGRVPDFTRIFIEEGRGLTNGLRLSIHISQVYFAGSEMLGVPVLVVARTSEIDKEDLCFLNTVSSVRGALKPPAEPELTASRILPPATPGHHAYR